MGVVIRNARQLQQAKEDLELLRKAWRKILAGGQEYEIENMNRVKRADLKEITRQISEHEAAIETYERYGPAGGSVKRVIPID